MGAQPMVQLLIATMMVTLTVLIHLGGLSALLEIMQQHRRRARFGTGLIRQSPAILLAAFGLFALHTLEIWGYAVLYLLLHALSDFEEALYFSTTTYTTLGYGDLVLPRAWRILGAIEAANGLILLGWSTAFFVSIVDEIRKIEAAADGAGRAPEGRPDTPPRDGD